MENKEMNFEASMKRLDEIVDALSNDSTCLDDGLKLYQEGVELIKKMETLLKESTDKVEKVVAIKQN